ncbi:uncharacterized protein [Haliotis asinina]|uniref:uncharacterized protein n=1 Tax=Haliotis asinina TaxID=109174 RepID=UPI003531E8AC
MSSGRFLSLGRNPLIQMQEFLEDESESFVIIPEEEETNDPPNTDDPHTHRIPLSRVQLQYMKSKPAVAQAVSQKLNDEGFRCRFDFDAYTVTIDTSGSKDEGQALQMIKDSIVEMDFSVDEIPLMQEGGVEALPTDGPGDTEVLIVRMGSVVKVVALADAAISLGHSLQRSRETLQSIPRADDNGSETILMPEEYANYLTQYKWTEVKTLLNRFPGVELTRAGNALEVKGPRNYLSEAVKVVNAEVGRVTSFTITLGPGISILAVADVSQRVGEKHLCIITPQQQIGFMEQTQSTIAESLRMSLPSAPRKTKVKVVMNALEKQKADVIVNTTNDKLILAHGRGVSWCLLQTAGDTIQKQLTKDYPNGIGNGEVAETGPGNIRTCKVIYHGALPNFPQSSSPNYQQEEDECFKWMVSLVFNCLIKASEKGYKTIAFPALGTGALEYPVQHVVQLMYKAIKLFNEDRRSGAIREIFIVIYPETKLSVKQLFLAHRHTYKLKTKHLATVEQFHEVKKLEHQRKCEIRVRVGNTLLQVVQGSVSDASEVTEAVLVLWNDREIENVSTNPGLTCTNAEKTDWQCSAYVSELSETRCSHDSTSLPFATLLHSYCPNNDVSTVTDAIAEAIRNVAEIHCNAFTIPLAPSSEIAKLPNTAAKMVFNGVKKADNSVFVVTVIIPDEHVFQPFCNRIAQLVQKEMQVPADIDKSPVAVDLWEKTYAEIASQTQTGRLAKMVVTIADSKYLVTSDSKDKNIMAAEDFKKELIKELPRNISHSYIRLGASRSGRHCCSSDNHIDSCCHSSSMSLGRYIDVGRNPIHELRSFLSEATEAEVVGANSRFLFIHDTKEHAALGAHTHPIPLTPAQIQYLQDKTTIQQSIKRALKDKGLSCEFHFAKSTVTIATQGRETETDALQIIKESIWETDISSDEIKDMEDSMETAPGEGSREREAHVLAVKYDTTVTVVGLPEVIQRLNKCVQGSRQEHGSTAAAATENKEVCIPMSQDCITYLNQYKWAQFDELTKRLAGIHITRHMNEIRVRGPPKETDEAASIIKGEVERVTSLTITLGPDISILAIGNVSKRVGEKYKCIISAQEHFGHMQSIPSQTLDSLSLSISEQKARKVSVVMNALEKQQADVIVNTTNTHLHLDRGNGVSVCISKAAGSTICDELKRDYPNGIQHGEVAQSGPGNIRTCKAIYHGALPPFPAKDCPDYEKKEEECFKWMVCLVFNCLIKASEQQHTSIAFPALGTGLLNYPVQHVVQLMYKAIRLFNEDKGTGSISEIIIVIYPETKLSVKQLFLAHRHTYKLTTKHLTSIQEFHEEMKKDHKRKCEVRVHVGNTLLQVVNAHVHDAKDVTEAILVPWNDKEIENPKDNPSLMSLYPGVMEWQGGAYVSELNETMCTLDSTSLASTTLVHSYIKNLDAASEAIAQGIRNVSDKLKCNTVTIPIVRSAMMGTKPNTAARLVHAGLKKASDCVHVVTVIVPDIHTFSQFATKLAELCNGELQVRADIDRSPVADDLWKGTYAEKAHQSQASRLSKRVVTIDQFQYIITSDADDTNRNAAEEFKMELAKDIPSHSYIKYE